MNKVSIVVPCFNEEEALPLFFSVVQKVTQRIPAEFEYWFIDDGSEDNTLQVIQTFRDSNRSVHYISFSRNFGKEAAMYAGLQATTGDYVAVMDADLQDPPELLLKMYQIVSKGQYDCVAAKRINRNGESKIKSLLANCFYRLINCLSTVKIIPGVRDYRMMNQKMLRSVLSLTEYNRFSKGIFSWVGFKTYYLGYSNRTRVKGHTDWSLVQLSKYAIDGIVDFSEVPLSLAAWVGFFSAILSFIGLVIVIIRHYLEPDASAFGWSSLVCIVLFLSGLQLWFTGILGKYIGNIYIQSKHRPIFIIRDRSE